MHTLENLNVYLQCTEYRKIFSPIIKALPPHEKFELASQMKRASRSPAANIAEGYGRYHHQENIQFCRISRGSLTEMKAHLNNALEESYISEQQYKELYDFTDKTIQLINGYIAYLKKERDKKKNKR